MILAGDARGDALRRDEKSTISPTSEVYLDHNATTPLAPEVAAAITTALSLWGNPSSANCMGRAASIAINCARLQVANLVDTSTESVVFTSGGTEANNWLIRSVVEARGGHVITSNIEHPSVARVLDLLEAAGKCQVTRVSAATEGRVSISDVSAELRSDTCLITIMLANNETGVIQPVDHLRDLVEAFPWSDAPAIIHTDASQAVGKIRVSASQLGVDALTLTGHKFYGPKVGALILRNLTISPMMLGGGQESGRRAGTENTPLLVGLGVACTLPSQQHHQEKMRDYLQAQLIQVPGVRVNCATSPRLPNTLSISLPQLPQLKFTLASRGAACHTAQTCDSVLHNSGVLPDIAATTLRMSVGRTTTEADIDIVVADIRRSLTQS